MGLFDNYPYYNPYQLNLDWIIAMMKKFEADYNQLDPESFLRKSGGLVNGTLQMDVNGKIDMNGKPLVGLKTAVDRGDALSFGQAEDLYLHKAGDKMTGDLDMDGHNIAGLAMPVGDADAATKQYVDLKIGTPEEPGAYLPLAGGMMSGDLNMDGHSLTGIPKPINGLDAVNKAYLDGINGAIRQWALGQFASSGYGLGGVGQTPTDNDANQITGSGFFRAFVNTPDPNVWWNIVNIECYEDLTTAFQIANGYKSTGSSSICVRQKDDNVWGEWEWVNPPMTLGIEYRTTERWNGHVVYTKYFNAGTAVNGASVRKPSGSSVIIRHQSFIGSLPLPLGQKYIERSGYFAYTASRPDDGFYLITDSLPDGYGNGGHNWFEQMWYTKK